MRANVKAAIACAAALVACGGNGGDDDDTPPPDASIVGVPGRYEVRGVVRYEDRAPIAMGNDGLLGEPTPVVSRGVAVALIDEDSGATLAMAVSGEDGGYALSFDGVGGQRVHVLVATSSTNPERPITVRRPGGMIHGFGSSVIQAGIDVEHDVLVTIASKTAQAFNIFDVCLHGMDRIRATFGTNPVPLGAIWSAGSNDGTYWDGASMHLLGASSDDDGFDDTVILHEFGHYIETTIGRSDSPGGGHNGEPVNPRLAWSEGFATYWAMAVRDIPLYIDSNVDGGFNSNADTEVTAANPNGPIDQRVSEDMVTEILWDLGDAPAADDDQHAGTHDAVLVVQPMYLKTAALRNVGEEGVDLVDFLDGWFLMQGLGPCAATRANVTTTRAFPYDYAGPAGPCP